MNTAIEIKPLEREISRILRDVFKDFLESGQIEYVLNRWHYTEELKELDVFFDYFSLPGKALEFLEEGKLTAVCFPKKFEQTKPTWKLYNLREEYFFKSRQPFALRDIFRRGSGDFSGYADHWLEDTPENYDKNVTPRVDKILSSLIPNWKMDDIWFYWGGGKAIDTWVTPARFTFSDDDRYLTLYQKHEPVPEKLGHPLWETECLFKEIPVLFNEMTERDRAQVLNLGVAEKWHLNEEYSLANPYWVSEWFGKVMWSQDLNWPKGGWFGSRVILIIHNLSTKELFMLFFKA